MTKAIELISLVEEIEKLREALGNREGDYRAHLRKMVEEYKRIEREIREDPQNFLQKRPLVSFLAYSKRIGPWILFEEVFEMELENLKGYIGKKGIFRFDVTPSDSWVKWVEDRSLLVTDVYFGEGKNRGYGYRKENPVALVYYREEEGTEKSGLLENVLSLSGAGPERITFEDRVFPGRNIWHINKILREIENNY